MAESPTGHLQSAVQAGPTVHGPDLCSGCYASPSQSGSLESWPASADEFGETTNYSSRPTPQDWIVTLQPNIPAMDIATAMMASRTGYPIWLAVEIQGAYHSVNSPPDSPPRICCRQFRGRAVYGADGHQTSMPPAIMNPFLNCTIQEQNARFLVAMTAAGQAIYAAFFAWLQTPAGEPFRVAAPKPSAEAYLNACGPTVTVIAFGGFGTDGGSVSWAVRDCLPMAVHILKHRLRAGQGRAVCHQDHVPMPSMPTKNTMEAAYDAALLTDIRAVRAHDVALMPAWDIHVRNCGLLPIQSVATVMGYFGSATV